MSADASAITVIRNGEIAHGTALWTSRTLGSDEGAAWLADHLAAGTVLVAEAAGEVIGFGVLGPWHPYEGYAATFEDSVYVADGARGRGVGRALLRALLEEADGLGARAVLAMIESGNAASVALHLAEGFRQVGQLPGVGAKFGRSLDLTLLEWQPGATPVVG